MNYKYKTTKDLKKIFVQKLKIDYLSSSLNMLFFIKAGLNKYTIVVVTNRTSPALCGF